MNRGRFLLILYLAFLAASHVVVARRGSTPEAGDRETVQVREVDGGATLDRSIQLAFQDLPRSEGLSGSTASASDNVPVVLIHGSPGSLQDFGALGQALSTKRRVLIPDLPGFGRSERRLADYSTAAHADYLLEWLDQLGVSRVDLVPFSMGGGVAIEVMRRAPERVRSIVFVACIGVQELELFGDHDQNHAVHAGQLGFIRALNALVPHFGALDRFPINIPYARNFLDTDQRPYRETLANITIPVLILHGDDDALVPSAVATEHHRIIPQSELGWIHGGHLLLWQHPDDVAITIENFLDRVDAGTAPTRAAATPLRIANAARPFDPTAVPPATGVALALLIFLIAVATLISEDLTCIAAGILIAQQRIAWAPGVLACLLGIFIGDMSLYFLGRTVGRAALSRRPLSWFISAKSVERASIWFREKGITAIFVSRFVPGLRLPTYVAAGVAHTPLAWFTGYFLLAAMIWTPLLVTIAQFTGGEALRRFESIRERPLMVVAMIILLYVVTRITIRALSWKGRRRLVGSWQRWRRWEFWPPWAFYPPLLTYIAWLALRHRSLSVVTAVNPAIENGGIIGESKSRILSALSDSSDHVASHVLLETSLSATERFERATEWLAQSPFSYPVVLKPDVGQRGSGVRIVRSEEELRDALASDEHRVDEIVQEFIPGREFGLFYIRAPHEPRGEVFSITLKEMPHVIGDGTRTLEELILADDRAVCMERVYCKLHEASLDQVIPAGDRTSLVDLGTHCRGAIFLDGNHLRSDRLLESLDRISRGFDGFYFGRYDVRAPSDEDLQNGRFKILELNGLTSEATHIYDPRFRLVDAYRILFTQWRRAFDIGKQNRDAGAATTSLPQVVREFLRYRGRRESHRHQSAPESNSNAREA